MTVSKRDVELAYRLFLGREPESESVVEKMQSAASLSELRMRFLTSAEFAMHMRNLEEKRRIERERPTLIHIHIPKTAGTSFNQMLVDSHPNKTSYLYQDADRADLFGLNDASRKEIDLIYGHMGWDIHKHLREDHIYLFVLREPIARVYSLFRFMKVSTTHPLHELLTDKSFGEFLDLSRENKNIHCDIDNAQMLRVSGGRKRARDPIPDYRKEFIKACANSLRPECKFGFVERFSDFTTSLRNDGILAPNSDDLLMNITNSRDAVETEIENLTPDQASLLERYVEWDRELYRFCSNLQSARASLNELANTDPESEI